MISADQSQGGGRKFLVFLYLSFINNYYFKSSEKEKWKPGLEFICVESLNINTDKYIALESYEVVTVLFANAGSAIQSMYYRTV